MLQRGFDPATAAVSLRLQCLPQIQFEVGTLKLTVGIRPGGSLKGTRTVGSWARVPVESTLQEVGYSLPEVRLRVVANGFLVLSASWIDNVYACGFTAAEACELLSDIDAHLRSQWQLHLKQADLEYMAHRGSIDLLADNACRHLTFKQVEVMNVLSHFVADDGGTKPDWDQCEEKMRNAYFRCQTWSLSRLSNEGKSKLLGNNILHLLRWLSPKWAWSGQLAWWISSTQKNLLWQRVVYKRQPGFSDEGNLRKRQEYIARLVLHQGCCSVAAKTLVSWSEHCDRQFYFPRPSPAALAIHCRGVSWLESLRLQALSVRGSIYAIDSRIKRGCPRVRWSERLVTAHVYVNKAITK